MLKKGKEVSPMDTVSHQGFGAGYRQSWTAKNAI